MQLRYNTLNNLVGWLVFLIAFTTYTLTVAPTASFWDCGEFIATANELEVPHPPGAPLYLMLGRFFAMFASAPENVAFMVNMVSVVASALLALFIFWTTTMLAKKVLAPGKDLSDDIDGYTTAVILFAGAVAGLTCTFLDTVWFNAVEAEVYAGSSMFTALVVWLMLKWEARADEHDHLRWIILIAYVMGLSVGFHLLNLLTLPALALLYFFKKYKFSWAGAGTAMAIGILILGVVQFGVIQLTWDFAWGLERRLVGTVDLGTGSRTGMGMPFGTGAIVFTVGLLVLLIAGIWVSHRQRRVVLHTALVGILAVYIGFSSYLTIMLRSNVDPPIDQNNPANLINFLSYLKREQYGDKPLLFGHMYNSKVKEGDPYIKNDKTYIKLEDQKRYVFDGYKLKYNYEERTLRFFPRMFDPDHYASGPYGYKNYVKNKGEDPNDPSDDKPTGLENLKFFFDYQVYHMYFRYVLWNFVGRESDVQHASWESGFEIAKLKAMPEDLRNHRTRNHYYGIPLLLGIVGLFWHFQNDKKKAAVVSILFLFTGLAIVVYLNQVAQEPRERDYAFVGSYHTFAIWVGLGVVSLCQLAVGFLKKATPFVVGTLCLLAVPGLLLAKNWDDHSRSGVFVPPDSAYNLLNSCAPNAIIFTNGDNDTFPLWYIQEVEGVRPDVRVVNLSLLNTDWYIYQLKHNKANASDPLPISFEDNFYMGEKNSAVPFKKQTLEIPVDKEAVIKMGIVKPEDADKIQSPMLLTITPRGRGENGYLQKQDLLILDMVINNAKQGWKRPIYFANTVGPSSYVSLGDYFELQGMAYRILPIRTKDTESAQGLGRVNLDVMYDNLMTKFRFRGLNDPNVFLGENTEKMVGNFRNSFFWLATAYLEAADKLEQKLPQETRAREKADPAIKEKIDLYTRRAREVIQYGAKSITEEAVPMSMSNLYLTAMVYDRLNDKKAANEMLERARIRANEYLAFLLEHNSMTYDDQNDYLMVLERIMQYRLANAEVVEAAKVAGDLCRYYPEGRYCDMARQLSGEVDKKPSLDKK